MIKEIKWSQPCSSVIFLFYILPPETILNDIFFVLGTQQKNQNINIFYGSQKKLSPKSTHCSVWKTYKSNQVCFRNLCTYILLGLEDLEKQSTMFWKSTYILLGLPMCEVVHPQDTQIWGLGPTFILRLISVIWIFNKGEWRQTCKRCWWKVFITAGWCKLYLPIGIQSAPVMIWVRIYSG